MTTDTDDLVPYSDAARALGVRPIDVLRAAEAGEIPAVRLHLSWLVPVAAARRVLAERAAQPAPPREEASDAHAARGRGHRRPG